MHTLAFLFFGGPACMLSTACLNENVWCNTIKTSDDGGLQSGGLLSDECYGQQQSLKGRYCYACKHP